MLAVDRPNVVACFVQLSIGMLQSWRWPAVISLATVVRKKISPKSNRLHACVATTARRCTGARNFSPAINSPNFRSFSGNPGHLRGFLQRRKFVLPKVRAWSEFLDARLKKRPGLLCRLVTFKNEAQVVWRSEPCTTRGVHKLLTTFQP
jgi:hypothetical protein